MNIAFVTSQVYPFRKGGTEKRVHEIGKRLASKGHDVTVYGCQWWTGPSEIVYEGMCLHGVCEPNEQYSNDRRSITEALRFSFKLTRPLLANRDEHDLIVACVSEHFPVWVASLVSNWGDVDLVTTWHEVWDYDYWTEYLGKLGVVGLLVQSITAKLPQRPITVSEMTADQLRSLSHWGDQIEVVPNGVDVDQIQSAPSVGEGYDVLFVGRLIPEKNVGLLLSAFDTVAEENDVTLGIIGDGPERNVLEKQAESLSNSEQVTFLGFVEDDLDVYGHMNAADVFVLPSSREGFGITVLESMAAGCIPVVVSHPNSAATEVVGEYGFVTEHTTPSVTEHISRAVDERDSDAVERARGFDWDEIANRAEQVYTDGHSANLYSEPGHKKGTEIADPNESGN